MSTQERLEVTRTIHAAPGDVFAVLCDPQGHVAIDATGMLQDASGDVVRAAGDSFVVHMDRESLGDLPELHSSRLCLRVATGNVLDIDSSRCG